MAARAGKRPRPAGHGFWLSFCHSPFLVEAARQKSWRRFCAPTADGEGWLQKHFRGACSRRHAPLAERAGFPPAPETPHHQQGFPPPPRSPRTPQSIQVRRRLGKPLVTQALALARPLFSFVRIRCQCVSPPPPLFPRLVHPSVRVLCPRAAGSSPRH